MTRPEEGATSPVNAEAGRAPSGRGSPRRHPFGPVGTALVALALLVACCPVPAGVGVETAFAAVVISVETETATVRLANGRLTELLLAGGQPSGLAPGRRVYVEGSMTGDRVVVSRLTVLPSGVNG